MILLDGKQASERLKREIAEEVKKITADGQKAPHLAAILVGENGASITYVNSKVKTCRELGFSSTLIKLPEDTSEQTLLAEIDKLNKDPEIDGFIVQLPLPENIDGQKVTMNICPLKDVDGFHPENIGKMMLGLPAFLPATPAGIIEILRQYEIETAGKHVVVLGRSNIVGMPVSVLLSQKAKTGNATVTICHSRTQNIKELCLGADIIIAAIGRPGFVGEDMVKQGAVIVDVGITRVPDSSRKSGFAIKGDVDFEKVAPKCSYITPVPGGVGLMTIAMLMLNTLKAREQKIKNIENG